MLTGYRFRLYPTRAQAAILLRWIGCQRVIYNAKVGEDRYFRTFARKALQHAGMFAPVDGTYAQFITDETAWLREVPAQVLRNGAASWVTAYSRFFKKLGGRPKLKRKSGRQSVWLTAELFRFEPAEGSYRFMVGTKKCPVGEIAYNAHRPHTPPASVRITLEAERWYLSFSTEDATILPDPQETADWLADFGHAELTERAVGIDRGVAVPFMCSDGARYDLDDIQKARVAKKQAAARRWQKKLARRAKGGQNRRKAARRIAALHRYETDVRRDFAHQTSHRIIADPRTLLIVFEALGVQRMTRRPKAKQDANGRWVRNGACAKAGLNRSILGAMWSRTKDCCAYKAQRAGKLVIDVPAHHTSQECSRCGYIHPENRMSQSAFLCQRCGHAENADSNAATNIRNRGVARIRSGGYRETEKKRIRRMRKKQQQVGGGSSEHTSVETMVSRAAGNGPALGSEKQKGGLARAAETPTSTTEG